MSRYSDVVVQPQVGEWPPLPIVDWQRIGHVAPAPLPVAYQGPSAPLPKADVVVLTWTSAEWSAFDHVFLNSKTTRPKVSSDWHHNWHFYSRSAPPPTPEQATSPLWGYYQMVEIDGATGQKQRVLLFKCDSHLAHPPWFKGLAQMVKLILEDTQPKVIYSIGTAGGTRLDVRLGDTVVTNAAYIKLEKPENADAGINNQSFVCEGSFPATTLFSAVQQQLFFHMSNVVTYPALQSALTELHKKVPDSANFGLNDLLNDALRPEDLHDSRALPMQGTQLLTTDYYYIATGDDAAQWAVLEMDDAVIAYAAAQAGVDYAFFRNISDPLVPSLTAAGATIPEDVRDGWSGLIYQDYGFYTSFNGALTTWAAIAGQE
jgi:nucleoside phosphorylase